MQLEGVKAIFFDNDGVLIDSITADFISFSALCESYKVPVDRDEWFKLASGNIAGYDALLKRLPLPLDQAKIELQKSWDIHLNEENITIMPGVKQFLSFIRALNLPVAVVTGASMEWAERWLNHFEIRDSFLFVTSGEECEKNKPDPMPYISAAQKLGVEPHECLVFEDSFSGMTAAKSAGMQVVAVTQYFSKHMEALCDSHYACFNTLMHTHSIGASNDR